MAAIPQQWQAYARLQAKVGKSRSIKGKTWGQEVALSFLLDFPNSSDSAIETAKASAARKHRYRVALLEREFEAQNDEGYYPDFTTTVDAAQLIKLLQDRCSSADWQMVIAIAEGHDYSSVATRHGLSLGAARTRISRIRARLESLAA